MNRTTVIALILLVVLTISCASTPTATTAPPLAIPKDYNEKVLDASSPATDIPVACNTANGNINVPSGSMPSKATVSIRCISPSQKSELTTLVKKKTNSTKVALGAVNLEPSPFKFNNDVTITIPLDPQRYDLRNTNADLYVYAPDLSGDLLPLPQAKIDSQGLTARARVDHFSIFILVGPEEGAGAEPEPATADPAVPPPEFVCEDSLGCIDVAPGALIRLAGMLDLTGQGEISVVMQDGIEDAVGAYGNIGGFAVQLETLDAGCNQEMGTDAAYRIASDPQIAGVIGTLCSSSASNARQILSDEGRVMVSPGNTRTSFTFSDRYPGYFRVATPDFHQAQIMARFAYNDLGLRRIGIYYADAEFGRDLAGEFSNQFREMGGEIIGYDPIPSGQTDFAEIATYVEDSQMDAVFMPLFTAEAGILTSWIREFGVGIPLLGTDAINITEFFDYAGEVDNFFYTAPKPPVFTDPYGYGYDAMRLLLEALARVAIVDASGSLHIGRQSLRDAMYEVSFSGRTGDITCDARGDCGHALIVIYVIKGNFSSEAARYTP